MFPKMLIQVAEQCRKAGLKPEDACGIETAFDLESNSVKVRVLFPPFPRLVGPSLDVPELGA
jgi:hypothetical protein